MPTVQMARMKSIFHFLMIFGLLSSAPAETGGRVTRIDGEVVGTATSLSPSSRVLSLSAVKDQLAKNRSVVLTNTRDAGIDTPTEITGADAKAFKIVAGHDRIEAGKQATWTVAFTPIRGAARYRAELQIGDPADGAVIELQGIGLAAFEGKNEAPLQDIVHAFGIPLDVGGSKLELGTKAATIGASVESAYFVPAVPGKIRVTPLARFSPPGLAPIGIFTKDGTELTRIGQLAKSTPACPDAHQSLLPPWESGPQTLEVDPVDKPLGFFMEGHHFTSFTDPARPSEAKIPHTARVYPVSSFQGEPKKNAWLVCFEEASNGDYQDAVILVENIKPANP